MLSLIWIVSCILIADALLRPGEESFLMVLVYVAFKTNTALATKNNHIICLLDYVCPHLVCGREETQGTKDTGTKDSGTKDTGTKDTRILLTAQREYVMFYALQTLPGCQVNEQR